MLLLLLALAACSSAGPPTATGGVRATATAQPATATQPRPTATAERAANVTPAPVYVAQPVVPPDDPRSRGSADAPVTIVEYADFECPFCLRYFREVAPEIERDYVATGLARVVYRDYPVLENHPSALLAALAGRCAAPQGQFWPMHDRLFATHGEEWGGLPRADRPVLRRFAEELGLDMGAFDRCVEDPLVEQAVWQDAEAGGQLGVSGTPAFVINGRLVQGAYTLEVFRAIIDQALARG